MNKEKKNKWYHKTGGIILWIILFYPVGLYLMWRYSSWSKKWKLGITGIYALLTMGMFNLPEQEVGNPNIQTSKPNVVSSPKPTSTPKSVEKMQIIVTSQIVKKVDGKYRYFFDIRNKDTKDFEGSVSITVYNDLQSSALGGDTFKTNKPIEPKLGTSVYFDINTGPTSVHGENGITKFRYVVKKDDQIINEGEDVISSKLENLTGF